MMQMRLHRVAEQAVTRPHKEVARGGVKMEGSQFQAAALGGEARYFNSKFFSPFVIPYPRQIAFRRYWLGQVRIVLSSRTSARGEVVAELLTA